MCPIFSQAKPLVENIRFVGTVCTALHFERGFLGVEQRFWVLEMIRGSWCKTRKERKLPMLPPGVHYDGVGVDTSSLSWFKSEMESPNGHHEN